MHVQLVYILPISISLSHAVGGLELEAGAGRAMPMGVQTMRSSSEQAIEVCVITIIKFWACGRLQKLTVSS